MKLINIHPKYLTKKLALHICKNKKFKKEYIRKYKSYFKKVYRMYDITLKAGGESESKEPESYSSGRGVKRPLSPEKDFMKFLSMHDTEDIYHDTEDIYHDTKDIYINMQDMEFNKKNTREYEEETDTQNIEGLESLEKIFLENYNTTKNLILFLPINLHELNLLRMSLHPNITISLPNLGSLINLTKLDLSFNNLGTRPDIKELYSIKSLVNLTVLNLSENKFSEIIEDDCFDSMERLTYLDLSHNNFRGTLAFCTFFGGRQLTELHLNNNNFEGEVSRDLMIYFNSITSNLANNLLHGIILPDLPPDSHNFAFGNNYFKFEKSTVDELHSMLDNLRYRYSSTAAENAFWKNTFFIPEHQMILNEKLFKKYRYLYTELYPPPRLDFDVFYCKSNLLQSLVYSKPSAEEEELLQEELTTRLQKCIYIHDLKTEFERTSFSNCYLNSCHGSVDADTFFIVPDNIHIIFWGSYGTEVNDEGLRRDFENIINGKYAINYKDTHIYLPGSLCHQHNLTYTEPLQITDDIIQVFNTGVYSVKRYNDLSPEKKTAYIQKPEIETSIWSEMEDQSSEFFTSVLGDNILSQIEIQPNLTLGGNNSLISYLRDFVDAPAAPAAAPAAAAAAAAAPASAESIFLFMTNCRTCANFGKSMEILKLINTKITRIQSMSSHATPDALPKPKLKRQTTEVLHNFVLKNIFEDHGVLEYYFTDDIISYENLDKLLDDKLRQLSDLEE